MILALFWGAAAIVLYMYVLFPLIVLLRGVFLRRPYKTAEITPQVSMIIAAHNEADSIGRKIENILSLDYPHNKLEVLIASDGSDDGTDEIVRQYQERGIRLLSLPRQGKAPALNAAVAASTGEILIFSDANSLYVPGAIRALVRPFADPEVGGVAGNQSYTPASSKNNSSDGEQSYWGLDRKLKAWQSLAGNVISATGAIYAIRRKLFRSVPTGVTDDFVTSTQVIAQGYRLVFALDAIANEPVAKSSGVEFGRKVRVMTRGLRGVWLMRELFNPFRYGFYALQVFSHKFLRRLMVFPLLVLLVVSPLLWEQGLFYQIVTVLQVALYGWAGLAFFLTTTHLAKGKLFTLPFFFVMVNAASVLAALNLLRGHQIDRWEPQRHTAS